MNNWIFTTESELTVKTDDKYHFFKDVPIEYEVEFECREWGIKGIHLWIKKINDIPLKEIKRLSDVVETEDFDVKIDDLESWDYNSNVIPDNPIYVISITLDGVMLDKYKKEIVLDIGVGK